MQSQLKAIDSGSQEARIRKLRTVLLLGSLAVLFLLLGAWWIISTWSLPPKPLARTSVFERQFDQLADIQDASAKQLLELADREVKRLLEVYPDSPSALNVKANRDYKISNISGAKEAWNRALKIDPLFPDGLFGVAMLDFEAGQYDSAIQLCEGLLRTNPGNPRVPLLLADSLSHRGDFEDATLVLEQHITTEPTSVQALEMLGRAHLSTQNYAKAISCFERALRYSPDSKDAYFGLGQAFARTGETEKAKNTMAKFAKLSDVSGQSNAEEAQAFVDRDHAAHVAAQVFLDSGMVAKSAGDSVRAEENVLQALQLTPDVVAWLTELRILYQSQNRIPETIDVLEKLAEIEPEAVDHWLALGTLYAELQQPDQAVDAFRTAIKIAPKDARCQRAETIIQRLK